MSFYERHVLPHLLHCGCGLKSFRDQRRRVVPAASGRVLEVGAGSGLNLPYYQRGQVSELILLEPESGMRAKLGRAIARHDLPVEMIGQRGEEIPLDDASVDSIVITYTMCTIPDLPAALGQMRRVLKPGGRLLFSEHGAAPDASMRRWQDRINPAWRRLVGGCNLNRCVDHAIGAAGFGFEQLDQGYIPAPRPWSYHYWGVARPA